MRKILLIFGLLFCGLSHFSNATSIYGKVSSISGEVLPFANVFIEGSSIGTTTNSDGLYQLTIEPGSHNIVFRFIGYKTQVIAVNTVSEKFRLDVELLPETIILRDVVINASGEDPAYAIIRSAIANRQKHLEETKAYSCDVYIKGLQKFLAIPKKVGIVKVDLGNQVDLESGVGYLSETVSKLYYTYPDKVKEEIISSKVSGNNRTFSFNRASDLMFNPYTNLVYLGGVSNRPFISPISEQAFIYYQYRLVGNFEDQGRLIYKIEVFPRREFDPVFRGFIFIEDENFHVQETDLYLTRQTRMEILDTLRIKQTFSPVSQNNWLPISLNLGFRFSLLGFEGDGYFHAIYSNYQIKDIKPLRNNKFEKVIIDEEANKKDSSYWEIIRPIPLSRIESVDYNRRDSIIDWMELPVVKDSLRKNLNRVSPVKILMRGYKFTNKKNDLIITTKPLIPILSFNTVQGYKGIVDIRFLKRLEKNRTFEFNPFLAIGTSDKTPNLVLSFEYIPEQVHSTSIRVSGGRLYSQFNPSNPVSDFRSTYSALLFERNHLKLYNSEFVELSIKHELFNGFYTKLNFKNSLRKPLTNNTSHTWIDYADKFYTSNDPLIADNPYFSFGASKATEVDLYLSYVLHQTYETIGGKRRILDKKGPALSVGIRSGIKDLLGGDTEFTELYGNIQGVVDLAMAGSGVWKIKGGYFINSNSMEFMDLHHTRTHKTNMDPFKFLLLGYYGSYTADRYSELHYEQRFNGLIWNKLPWVRRLKINEIAGIHLLHTDSRNLYYEFTAGLEKLNLRADLVLGVEAGRKPVWGLKFDVKLP